MNCRVIFVPSCRPKNNTMDPTCVCRSIEGTPASKVFESMLGSCLYGKLGIASGVIGLASIIIWLITQWPQIRYAFITLEADGLSLFRMCLILTSDLCNITSAILLNQLMTLIITTAWFTIADFIILMQYFLLPVYARLRHIDLDERKTRSTRCSGLEIVIYVLVFVFIATVLFFVTERNMLFFRLSDLEQLQECVGEGMSEHNAKWYAGTVLSYITMAFYITGEIYQIVQNYRKKTTEGISILYIALLATGNLCDSLSVIFGNVLDRAAMIESLPYYLEPMLNMCLESVIVGQSFYYARKYVIKQADIEALHYNSLTSSPATRRSRKNSNTSIFSFTSIFKKSNNILQHRYSALPRDAKDLLSSLPMLLTASSRKMTQVPSAQRFPADRGLPMKIAPEKKGRHARVRSFDNEILLEDSEHFQDLDEGEYIPSLNDISDMSSDHNIQVEANFKTKLQKTYKPEKNLLKPVQTPSKTKPDSKARASLAKQVRPSPTVERSVPTHEKAVHGRKPQMVSIPAKLLDRKAMKRGAEDAKLIPTGAVVAAAPGAHKQSQTLAVAHGRGQGLGQEAVELASALLNDDDEA